MIKISEFNGIVLAGMGTYMNRVKQTLDKREHDFLDDYSKSLKSGLECFGYMSLKKTLLKKPQRVLKKTTDKIEIVRNIMNKDYPFMIDSGGFQVISGNFEKAYISALGEIYSDYIKNDPLENALYFYFDITPSNGVTEKEAYSYLCDFHDSLIEKTKINQNNKKVYFVYQSVTKKNYDLFTKFIKDKKIYETLNSHRWAMGGLVPVNLNDSAFSVRPYLIPFLNIINMERDYLESGGHVYYHVLGVSSVYDMIMFTWFMIYCKHKEININFTFDSTTAIYSATKNGYVYYVDEETGIPYSVLTAKKSLSWPIGNPDANNLTNEEALNIILDKFTKTFKNREYMKDKLFWYDENDRWNNIFLCMMCCYAFHGVTKAFDAIYNLYESNSNLILEDVQASNLFNFTKDLVDKLYLKSTNGMCLRATRFSKNIFFSMSKTFNEFKNILNGKSSESFINECHSVTKKKYSHLNTIE